MKGFLFVVSGPSGVGKTVLCSNMMDHLPDHLVYSISATSRSPRGKERHGQEYFFYTREQFEKAIKENQFAEWAIVHDNYYGTPKPFVDEQLAKGKSILMNIDVQGGLKIRSAYPGAVLFFILPPSMDALENRLRKRNIDSEEVLKRRLVNAKKEMEFQGQYNHVVVNDDLKVASETLAGIIKAYIHSTP